MDASFCSCRPAAQLDELRGLCQALVAGGTVPEILRQVVEGARSLARADDAAGIYRGEEVTSHAAPVEIPDQSLLGHCRRMLGDEREPPPPGMIAIPLLDEARRRVGLILIAVSERGLDADAAGLLGQLASFASLALQRSGALAEAEARTAEIAQALRAADWRKDAFVAQLAHELRAPLAPLIGGVQILRRTGPETKKHAEALEVVERQAWHMARLIDDLLDVARVAQGRIKLHRQRVDLVAVTRNAAAAVQLAMTARGHRFQVEEAGTPLHVHADPVRLLQILGNLLGNAVKYTPAGGEVTLSTLAEGDRALVRVRDNGIGFLPEELPGAFQLFTQFDRGAGSESGLGVGLALARKLAELSGGTLDGSSPGRGFGSEFVLRLPLAATRQPSAGARDSALVIDGP